MKTVDYSERAVTQRLRQASQLRRLCLSLMKAKPRKALEQQSPPDAGEGPPPSRD